MDEVRLLRLSEVAELLGISRTKVYELVASGQIPSLHLGRIRRVPLMALRDWINDQTERNAPLYLVNAPLQAAATSRPASTIPPRRGHRSGDPHGQPRTPTQQTTEAWPFFKPWMPAPDG